jgi:chemotaxis protein methyltransferase CheR
VFDIVFFRNVIIYFDKNTQEAVINKICRNLTPGGYLFVGHSESLAGLDIPVRQVQTAIYRKPA